MIENDISLTETMKIKEMLLKPLPHKKVDTETWSDFHFFEIIVLVDGEDDFRVLSEYDYIRIHGNIRIDMFKGATRLYPVITKDCLYYNPYFHIISDTEDGTNPLKWRHGDA